MIEVKPFEKNRYTQTHNIVYDYMMRRLSGNSFKVLSLIIRLTSGWHKDYDVVSYSQIVEYTGIKSNTTISKSIKELLTLGYIVRIPDRETEMGTYMYKYGLNHNLVVMVDDSEPSSENDTSSEYVPSPNNEQGTSPNNEQVPSSNNEYTKEREKEEINNTPQQNFNVSDNLNLETLPDGDSSLLENTTTHKSPTKTDKATEGTPDALTTSQQSKECLNDYFPREDPVETQPTGKHSAAEVRESSAAALRNYAQRNSAEPWREWFPSTVKDVNGVPAYELQKVGHTLCSVTGWQPDPRMVKTWLPELARLYELAGGKVKYIQSATEEVWQREPQYRPKSPHGLAQPVMDYRARSKPPSQDELRKLWNLGGR